LPSDLQGRFLAGSRAAVIIILKTAVHYRKDAKVAKKFWYL